MDPEEVEEVLSDDEMEYVVLVLQDAVQQLKDKEQAAIRKEADLQKQYEEATSHRIYIQHKIQAVEKYIRSQVDNV